MVACVFVLCGNICTAVSSRSCRRNTGIVAAIFFMRVKAYVLPFYDETRCKTSDRHLAFEAHGLHSSHIDGSVEKQIKPDSNTHSLFIPVRFIAYFMNF